MLTQLPGILQELKHDEVIKIFLIEWAKKKKKLS